MNKARPIIVPPKYSSNVEGGKLVVMKDGAPRWDFESWRELREMLAYLRSVQATMGGDIDPI